ncbi:MAG: DUF4064 domain-containing protein [archaeon]|nr:DUF4064 domain-containing protein [archaeon]
MATEERPTAAFTLSIIGVAFQFVAGLFLVFVMFTFPYTINNGHTGPGMMMPVMMFSPVFGFGIFWLILAILIIAIGLYGALLMNSSDLSRVRTGSTLVLIASILAFPVVWGFIVGSLLMFIGSILGLTWQPIKKG